LKKLISGLGVGLIFTLLSVSIHNAFLLNDYKNTTAVDKVEILIEPGDSGSEIAQKLREAGVIKAERSCEKPELLKLKKYFTKSPLTIKDLSQLPQVYMKSIWRSQLVQL